jgi:nucleotide-binding universal stress UspA family protein
VTDPVAYGGTIVVGVDGSMGGRLALAWALEEAEFRHAEIAAVFAWQLASLAFSAPGLVMPSPEEIDAEGRAVLDKTLKDLPGSTDVKVRLQVYDGPPAQVLQMAAGEPDVHVVVVGSRGHGAVAEVLLGSVSHGLTHHCPKPLVIIHQPAATTAVSAGRGIVVGVDGSPEADAALRWAAHEARIRSTPLRAVVAWSASRAHLPTTLAQERSVATGVHAAAHDVLDRAIERLAAPDVAIERTVQRGRPAAVLMELAAPAELLVVGSRGLGRAQETLHGSVSHACSHRSPVPVAIIPSSVSGR